ncbi:putative GABA permease [Aspergillus cavernicola]|uniref:GABA permease n=1 Tax=Aspergillus cavernicola TaxID=176166 RepID=A0ABR4IFF7_9EURO
MTKKTETIDQGVSDALSAASDAQLLATLGYKQELWRHYSTVQVFAIAFSIMGLLPSIAPTLSFSIPAGPVGMVWVCVVFCVFIFLVGLAMAGLASAMPTAGGLYFWTHHFSGERWKNPLSFVVGYSNTIGLIGGVCSIDYGFATMLLAIISIARDGTLSASRPVVYGTYVGCVVVHGLTATFFARIMPKIQSVCIVTNIGLVIATVLALPIGKVVNEETINSGTYVFGQLGNLTTWPKGWAFMLAWLSPIWTIGGFDSCVHMSEEATNAAHTGYSVIYYDCLGKPGALGFMAVVAMVQFFMGLSLLIAASRQSWAFSRDGALPFSSFFRHVSKRIHFQPVRMIWGVVGATTIIGFLSLINAAAANAIFSLPVAGNVLAWMVPILCRLVWSHEEQRFHPGVFYTGRWVSRPIAVVAVAYLGFAIGLCMVPTLGPGRSSQNMNYTVVINGALWGGALLYYLLYARKTYKRPQATVHSLSLSTPAETNGESLRSGGGVVVIL